MASFPVTITVQSTPSIEVFGVNISYEQILMSLGSYFYLIEHLFIESRSYLQTNQPVSFEHYDVNGSKKTDMVIPSLDPYQQQPTLMLDLREYKLVVDGRLIQTFEILPNGWVRFTYITQRGDVQNGLNKFGQDNKSQLKNV